MLAALFEAVAQVAGTATEAAGGAIAQGGNGRDVFSHTGNAIQSFGGLVKGLGSSEGTAQPANLTEASFSLGGSTITNALGEGFDKIAALVKGADLNLAWNQPQAAVQHSAAQEFVHGVNQNQMGGLSSGLTVC